MKQYYQKFNLPEPSIVIKVRDNYDFPSSAPRNVLSAASVAVICSLNGTPHIMQTAPTNEASGANMKAIFLRKYNNPNESVP